MHRLLKTPQKIPCPPSPKNSTAPFIPATPATGTTNCSASAFSSASPPQPSTSARARAGIVQQTNFRGLAARVCGVDLDPRVVDNPMLDEGKIADAGGIPYPDAAFDVVFADNVLEHLPDPLAVFREIARVLKPGGVFLFKTPNKTHYMPTIARLTPHRFHQFVNRLRGRAEIDTFPTRYEVLSFKF